MDLMLSFQSVGDGLQLPMRLFSSLGVEAFYLLVMPALLWCYDLRLGARVGLILLTSSGLNSAIKLAFGLPRPFWLEPRIKTFSSEASFGFPSGHAQNAVSVWGRMAAGFNHRIAWTGAVVLTLLISLSRVYLGMHFPVSILGGWAFGFAILLTFLALEDRVGKWIGQRNMTIQYAIPPLASALLLLINYVPFRLSGHALDPGWATAAATAQPTAIEIEPFSPTGFVSIAGVLLGFSWGLTLLKAWGRYSVGGTGRQLLGRFLLGALGVALIFFGLDLVLPDGSAFPALVGRYLRYAAVGIWISYAAPRLFVLVKLAGTGTRKTAPL
jgi:membrane-associated phospholipid phosphatase